MIKYIYTDMLRMFRFLPGALLIGIPISLGAVLAVNAGRGKRGKETLPILPKVLFGIYLSVMLLITFLSRESGSSRGGADFRLFSTMGINARNDAFVVENVLLFIPYGFVSGYAFKAFRNFFRCALFGMATSLCIECMQLVTGRGFFQVDDILTNTLGAMLGCLVYLILFRKKT